MHTETIPTKSDWSATKGETAVFLLLMVVLVSDMPEPIPFWPLSWGQAPSVGTVLLIVAIIVALARFGDRLGFRAERDQ